MMKNNYFSFIDPYINNIKILFEGTNIIGNIFEYNLLMKNVRRKPMIFGMLFSIPRDEKEADKQIPKNMESIMRFNPNIIGLVSPSDPPGSNIRTRMWDRFSSIIKKENLIHLVMQHFPYTSIGNIGKIHNTQITMDNIEERLRIIKQKGINNVLALKGWEQNDNYLKENQVSANQPEYLFKSVPDWISYLKYHFSYISGTTYIEGHPFRRRKINSEKNKGKEFHAIKKEYNLSGKKCYIGILKENLIAAIKYDIQKIKSGAQKIFCAHIFNANLFIEYKKKFESFSNNTIYELIPEISVGASKRSFYNDTLLSSTYCTDDFQDTIFKYGENIFDINLHVNIIGKGKELEIISQRKNYYKAII